MRRNPKSVAASPEKAVAGEPRSAREKAPTRSGIALLSIFLAVAYCSWSVYDYQFNHLPPPLTAAQAGKRGFSEVEALKHVKAVTQLGPHSVASDSLDLAIQYVLEASEAIKKTAHWEVDVEMELFKSKSGANNKLSGMFIGKTLAYSDLEHVILRISPKYSSDAVENAILVSSHIDSVFSGGGAGDCSSCISVMLEVARGISQLAHGFKHAVIFLFNIGEEEGLNGAHSFVTQHPWIETVRMAIDLEAMGIGGKSAIFQAGPNPWAVENFAASARYPAAQVIAEDLFSAGIINSATDFQIYREISGLSGLDFVYTDLSAVYHTKNDKYELLKAGSLQHLGENMLAFLFQTATSPHLPKASAHLEQENAGPIVYFDILGSYMVVFRHNFASLLHNSVIIQSLLIWATSLFIGGRPAVISFGLSCLSIVLTLIFAIAFAVAVAFIVPVVASFPAPFIASPWLVFGLFAAPALVGALTGQSLGYIILKKYLSKVYSKRTQLSPSIQADTVKLEAERWLYKSGSIQWLLLLILGNYFKVASSYLALAWLVPPTFAYGLLEATLSPARLPRPMKLVTLVLAMAVPILLSAGVFIRLPGTLIATWVRFDKNPGATADWLGNAIVAVYIAVVLSLTVVYLLSYVHLSGMKKYIILSASLVLALSLLVVSAGIVPPFTNDIARTVNVVQVVDARGNQDPRSYVSMFSTTPGDLTKEINEINEGFTCDRDEDIDFVTFSVKYGCKAYNDEEGGWPKADLPLLRLVSDTKAIERTTHISIDTKSSTRWALSINFDEIQDFALKDAENSEEIIEMGEKRSVNGWHIIQFAGGKKSSTVFDLTLVWKTNSSGLTKELVKLRTDMDVHTPKVERVLSKLPSWCSQFGKSTSPHTLAFLTSFPTNF